ncbi:MAG: hypothetical protein AAF823_12310 [Planctomycetota bacterium]
MQYETWRNDIFNLPENTDPVNDDLPSDRHELNPERTLDFIDRALIDPDIHERYSRTQIGIGLSIIFDDTCGNGTWDYIACSDRARAQQSVQHLVYLYRNFFDRYCPDTYFYANQRNVRDDRLGYLCSMFWEIFTLVHGDASDPLENAALEVMRQALQSSVPGSLESAINGLGEAVYVGHPASADIIRDWLRKPTATDPDLLRFAEWAITAGS